MGFPVEERSHVMPCISWNEVCFQIESAIMRLPAARCFTNISDVWIDGAVSDLTRF